MADVTTETKERTKKLCKEIKKKLNDKFCVGK